MNRRISEAASEKARPGRPAVIPDAFLEAGIQGRFVKAGATRRQQLNGFYTFEAASVLNRDTRFEWLINDKPGRRGWKPTILSELGRIGDSEAMKALALQLCEAKPKAKTAVAMIRAWRLGRDRTGDADGVADALRAALNAYMETHPTSWDDVVTALKRLRLGVEFARQEGGGQDGAA